MTTRPLDSKREEFRKYLERTGVTDAVTKIFRSLYEQPEKPSDALGFFVRVLTEDRSDSSQDDDNTAELLAEEKNKNERLETELESARRRIKELEDAAKGGLEGEREYDSESVTHSVEASFKADLYGLQ